MASPMDSPTEKGGGPFIPPKKEDVIEFVRRMSTSPNGSAKVEDDPLIEIIRNRFKKEGDPFNSELKTMPGSEQDLYLLRPMTPKEKEAEEGAFGKSVTFSKSLKVLYNHAREELKEKPDSKELKSLIKIIGDHFDKTSNLPNQIDFSDREKAKVAVVMVARYTEHRLIGLVDKVLSTKKDSDLKLTFEDVAKAGNLSPLTGGAKQDVADRSPIENALDTLATLDKTPTKASSLPQVTPRVVEENKPPVVEENKPPVERKRSQLRAS